MVKLHIGCGKRNFGEDWQHIDGIDLPHIVHKSVTKLSHEDNSVDLIYASHLVAYFDRSEILDVLQEWKRVLKNGGILRLATPDFEIISKLYSEGKYYLASFAGPLYGKMEMNTQTIYHKTAYDFTNLRETLMIAGFKDVKRYDWKQTDHSQHDDHSQAYLPHMNKQTGTLISLNVECIKQEKVSR
jgi:predicted SAM-dependent methyltransferase